MKPGFALFSLAFSLASATALHGAASTGPTVDAKPLPYGSRVFRPAALWLDDQGHHINAHGGGVLFVPGDNKEDGTYYWFGEHKVAGGLGNTAQVGVHVYSPRLYSRTAQGDFQPQDKKVRHVVSS
jgi:hypothetical protein